MLRRLRPEPGRVYYVLNKPPEVVSVLEHRLETLRIVERVTARRQEVEQAEETLRLLQQRRRAQEDDLRDAVGDRCEHLVASSSVRARRGFCRYPVGLVHDEQPEFGCGGKRLESIKGDDRDATRKLLVETELLRQLAAPLSGQSRRDDDGNITWRPIE